MERDFAEKTKLNVDLEHLNKIILQDKSPSTSLIRKMLIGHDGPVVVMNSIGEYGWFILHHIKYVNFYNSPEKIVCISPGEECYFPSASQFYYTDFDVADSLRICTNDRRKYLFKDLPQQLALEFPDALIIDCCEVLPMWYSQQLKFTIEPIIIRNLSPDIVIGARNRQHRSNRNYKDWNKIIDPLLDCGYSIGIVGREETTLRFPDKAIHSWDYGDANAMIEMLQNCRMFVGTDTGTSHAAAFMGVPMTIFKAPDRHNFIRYIQANKPKYFKFIKHGWSKPQMVVDSVLEYLDNN